MGAKRQIKMKKITTITAILILGTIVISSSVGTCSTNLISNEQQAATLDAWTGTIRIEGETETIWKGTVSFSSSIISAENMDTHEMENHEIEYPSVLGALDKASTEGGFSYTAVYYPSWNSLYVTSIGGDSAGEKTGWGYWVDYEMPMVGADSYELTSEDDGIIWGFLYYETWETSAHALKIDLDKQEVKKNEELVATVTDELMNPVDGAIVYIDSNTFTTDENGEAVITLGEVGTYNVYAEKAPSADDTYVRSDKESLDVKKGKSTLIDKILEMLIELFPFLEGILAPFIQGFS